EHDRDGDDPAQLDVGQFQVVLDLGSQRSEKRPDVETGGEREGGKDQRSAGGGGLHLDRHSRAYLRRERMYGRPTYCQGRLHAWTRGLEGHSANRSQGPVARGW